MAERSAAKPLRQKHSGRLLEPIREFLGPARRRTDNPIVIATFMLLLGVIAVSCMTLIAINAWSGMQTKIMIDEQRRRDKASDEIHQFLVKANDRQLSLLMRFCVNSAKTPTDT